MFDDLNSKQRGEAVWLTELAAQLAGDRMRGTDIPPTHLVPSQYVSLARGLAKAAERNVKQETSND